MADRYSQLYIQLVIGVKGRQNLLQKEWRQELFKYMSSIIAHKEHKPIIINGVEDHVHIFFGLNPSKTIADLVRDIKSSSSNLVNRKQWVKGKFQWQGGYGAFSYNHSLVDRVYQYILNQEEHHKKRTFKEEYLDFLKKFEIEYKDQYLFDWIL